MSEYIFVTNIFEYLNIFVTLWSSGQWQMCWRFLRIKKRVDAWIERGLREGEGGGAKGGTLGGTKGA